MIYKLPVRRGCADSKSSNNLDCGICSRSSASREHLEWRDQACLPVHVWRPQHLRSANRRQASAYSNGKTFVADTLQFFTNSFMVLGPAKTDQCDRACLGYVPRRNGRWARLRVLRISEGIKARRRIKPLEQRLWLSIEWRKGVFHRIR